MDTFWAYENWRARGHRVTVHRGSCAHCKDGKGGRGGTRADNGKWHKLGSFASAEAALEAAKIHLKIDATRTCGFANCG